MPLIKQDEDANQNIKMYEICKSGVEKLVLSNCGRKVCSGSSTKRLPRVLKC